MDNIKNDSYFVSKLCDEYSYPAVLAFFSS